MSGPFRSLAKSLFPHAKIIADRINAKNIREIKVIKRNAFEVRDFNRFRNRILHVMS